MQTFQDVDIFTTLSFSVFKFSNSRLILMKINFRYTLALFNYIKYFLRIDMRRKGKNLK